MEGMTEAQKLSTLSTIFGTEAASGMMCCKPDKKSYGMTKELENSAGASAEAATQMKDNLTGSLDELSGSIESATISVMSQLTPMIREIAERVTGLVNAFNELPDGTKKLIAMTAGIAAVAGPVLTVLR
jgi:TP901 family phage tail tape measure protein